MLGEKTEVCFVDVAYHCATSSYLLDSPDEAPRSGLTCSHEAFQLPIKKIRYQC